MKLTLKRPLVLFDLETTGTNPATDRIVEISLLKVMPDGSRHPHTTRVNPTIPIPASATAIHHITDEMVSDCRKFADIASGIARFMSGCDIAGFNSSRFDVPLLQAEMRRAGVKFDTSDTKFIDVQTIYHKREPRNLSAAYRFYCGRELEGAHGAEADINATFDVLLGQIEMYDDLPRDVDGLAQYTAVASTPNAVDSTGRLVRNDKGIICFNFSRFKGKPVKEVFMENPGMINWCLSDERGFSDDLTEIFKKIADSCSNG